MEIFIKKQQDGFIEARESYNQLELAKLRRQWKDKVDGFNIVDNEIRSKTELIRTRLEMIHAKIQAQTAATVAFNKAIAQQIEEMRREKIHHHQIDETNVIQVEMELQMKKERLEGEYSSLKERLKGLKERRSKYESLYTKIAQKKQRTKDEQELERHLALLRKQIDNNMESLRKMVEIEQQALIDDREKLEEFSKSGI